MSAAFCTPLCLMCSVMACPLIFSTAGMYIGVAMEPAPKRNGQRHRCQHVRRIHLLIHGPIADHRPSRSPFHRCVQSMLLIEPQRLRHDDRRTAGDGNKADAHVFLFRRSSRISGKGLEVCQWKQFGDNGRQRRRSKAGEKLPTGWPSSMQHGRHDGLLHCLSKIPFSRAMSGAPRSSRSSIQTVGLACRSCWSPSSLSARRNSTRTRPFLGCLPKKNVLLLPNGRRTPLSSLASLTRPARETPSSHIHLFNQTKRRPPFIARMTDAFVRIALS